jgi:DNA-binding FadR family transcriptional regulator
LQRIATDLRRQMERFEYTFFSSPAALEASLKRHRKLVQILRTHDPVAAQRALERQWDLGRQTLRQMLGGEAEEGIGLEAGANSRTKSSGSLESSGLER